MGEIKSFRKKMGELWYLQLYNLWMVLSFFALLILFSHCTQPSVKQGSAAAKFIKPELPSMLTSLEQRDEYMVAHYWDNFDFSDSTLVANADITEQAFVNYINLFPQTRTSVVERSISALLGEASDAGTKTFWDFAKLFEKYLYDPNSPFRNEDYYMAVLHSIINNNQVDEYFKVHPRHQLDMALKNRPGSVANDFEFSVSNGRTTLISNISGDYIILFFNNPDCQDCARIKQVLSQSAVVKAMTHVNSRPTLRIAAIYPDEDLELWRKTEYPGNWINGYSRDVSVRQLYDLRAVPTLYLLDKSKRVLLKDVAVEIIIDYLQQHTNTNNKY